MIPLRTQRSLLLAVTACAVFSVASAGLASAAGTAKASGPWNYTLTAANGKATWSAYVLQVGPMLAGKATLKGGCTANINGSIQGTSFKMKWSCGGDTVKLKGTIAGHGQKGTFTDSKLGKGPFVAKPGSNEDDGSGDGNGDGGGGDGGGDGGGHGGGDG
jgi:uncharacterized membrane protein YgcG